MERAIPIDLGIKWTAGAPVPTVLADEDNTYLVFDLCGTDLQGGQTGVITWTGLSAFMFGFPNDEAQHGHRLWRSNGEVPPYYEAVEVVDSTWLAELIETERSHPNAPAQPFASSRHFVLLFHDSTFECIATGYRVERRAESSEAVVAELAKARLIPSHVTLRNAD